MGLMGVRSRRQQLNIGAEHLCGAQRHVDILIALGRLRLGEYLKLIRGRTALGSCSNTWVVGEKWAFALRPKKATGNLGRICWKNKRQRKIERKESEELGIWGEEEWHFVRKFPAHARTSFR